MDLFDAATDEMKRKRNQKKDGSVLRRMERLSGLVEPTEVVYSPGGNIKKARHIDDLEDGSSLIEGESPLPMPKPVRPRKRQPLADRDANAPRLVRHKTKQDAPKKQAGQSYPQGLPPLPYLPSSSTGESYGIGGRFLPAEEDDEDFKPVAGSLSSRKRHSLFTIFDDGSPGYGPSNTMEQGQNPFHSGHPSQQATSRSQLPVVSAPWLQPQHQSSLQYPNPYSAYRPVYREYQSYYDANPLKENLPVLPDSQSELQGPSANPLLWKSPVRDVASLFPPPESPFGNLFGLFPLGTSHDDPFVTTRNHLVEALEQLDDQDNSTHSKNQPRQQADTMSDNEIKYRPRSASLLAE